MKVLISIHHANDYDPSAEGDEMRRDIDHLNEEMVNAGVRIFVGGLQSPANAKTITHDDGRTIVAEGTYLKTSEHVAGFWVLEVASIEEAIEWGRKAALACRAAVEVRPFN